MKLGDGNVRSYRKAANYLSKQFGPNERIEACFELVQGLEKTSQPDLEGLVLPLKRNQPEALLRVLACKAEVSVILPVCPPFALAGQRFDPSLSPEAKAGIRAANVLAGPFAEMVKTAITPIVLVADTEADIEAVVKRSGGREEYLRVCSESADLAAAQLNNGAIAGTFSSYFGEQAYRQRQYAAEAIVRVAAVQQPGLNRQLASISSQRAAKHALILGRPEQDNELAVRYAAQYTALGAIVRERDDIDLICNYPTPNNQFYNSGQQLPIAVFESRVERRHD